jgi:radical SAM protein with 4Fe4S-binding SPASM domain
MNDADYAGCRMEVRGRLDDAGDFPKVILIDTVSHCNLKCAMCVHRIMKRKKGVMKVELFRKIIDEISLRDKDARVWMVFFGEALLLKGKIPSIFDLIAYAKEKGLTDVVLNSNGTLLDDDCAVKLIESGLDAIYIGIDAFNEETYSRIRVGGEFSKTVENTKNLLREKERLGSSKPAVYVQFVEMEANRREKEGFIEFWKDLGAVVKIRPMVSWAGSVEAPNQTLDNDKRRPCYWAMQTMSITDTGKVVTCAVDLDARFVAGDINNQTLLEAWNGKLKELRRFHSSGSFSELPENCRNCRDWQSAKADFF